MNDYESFRCVRPEPNLHAPIYYPRERTFNVGKLLALSAAMVAGWGLGHLPVQVASGALIVLVGVLMIRRGLR